MLINMVTMCKINIVIKVKRIFIHSTSIDCTLNKCTDFGTKHIVDRPFFWFLLHVQGKIDPLEKSVTSAYF